MTFWDKEAIYDEHMSPLVSKLIALCKEHQMPLVVQVQYCNDEERGPGFCTTTIPINGLTDEKMMRVIDAAQPERPVCLAETTVTNPDGSKHITIRQVR